MRSFAHSLAAALLASLTLAGTASAMSYQEALVAEEKLDIIAREEMQPGEEITLTDEEINSYLHYIYAEEMPDGVRGLRVRFRRDTANVSGFVDLSKVSQDDGGPSAFFMRLLSGERQIDARVRYVSSNGEARMDVESLLVDGREMKGRLLDWLVDAFVTPNFEGFALGEPVPLGHNIERVRLETGVATIIGFDDEDVAQ